MRYHLRFVNVCGHHTQVPTDFVTLLECEPGYHLTKHYFDIEKPPIAYDTRATVFKFLVVPLQGLYDLYLALHTLQDYSNMCLVRGGAKASVDPNLYYPRRKIDRPDQEAPLEPTAHHWFGIDVDESQIPLDSADIRSSIERFRATLPDRLRTAATAVQLSAKAHLSPTIRFKAYFWSATKLTDADLKAWAKKHGFDAGLYSAEHIHYTAPPMFANGLADPLEGQRLHWFDGGEAVLEIPAETIGTQPKTRGAIGPAIAWDGQTIAPSERATALANLPGLQEKWLAGGRIGTGGSSVWLNWCGWLLGKGWSKDELAAMLAILDEGELDLAKRAEHLRKLSGAAFLTGPSPELIEWFGELWGAVDAQVKATLPTLSRPAQTRPSPPSSPDTLPAMVTREGGVWLLQNGTYGSRIPQQDLAIEILDRGLDQIIHMVQSKDGAVNARATIEKNGAKRVRTLVCDFASPGTVWDPATATLTEGFMLPTIAPVYDEGVEKWLEALFGPGLQSAKDWMVSCQQKHINKLAACMVIVGPHSIGKTLVFTALSRLWGMLIPVPLALATADFNGDQARGPIVLDDECATLKKGIITSAQFRARIQDRVRFIQLKGKERTQLLGATRECITANELSDIRFTDVSGPDAVSAIAERMALHVVPEERVQACLRALEALRPNADDNDVDMARICGHFAWIWANHALHPRRFVGARTDGSGRLAALAGHFAENAAVFERLQTYLDGTNRTPIGGMPSAFLRDGVLWVHPTNLASDMAMLPGWPLKKVQAALRPVRQGPPRNVMIGGHQSKYWGIPVEAFNGAVE